MQTAPPPLRLLDVRLAARTTSVSVPGAAAAQAMLCKRLERGAGLHRPRACRAVVQVWRLASSAHALHRSRSGRWPSSSRQHWACMFARACKVLSECASATLVTSGLRQVTEYCRSRYQLNTAQSCTPAAPEEAALWQARPSRAPQRSSLAKLRCSKLKNRGLRTCSKTPTPSLLRHSCKF